MQVSGQISAQKQHPMQSVFLGSAGFIPNLFKESLILISALGQYNIQRWQPLQESVLIFIFAIKLYLYQKGLKRIYNPLFT